MRLISIPSNNSARFTDGARPPLDLIPEQLAELLRERDRMAVQRQEAETHLRDLQNPEHDTAAEQADALSAAKAARAGKPIPEPVAVRTLEKDREDAARAHEAQVAAFQTVTEEAARVSEDVLGGPMRARRTATLAKARAKVEAQAHKLADAIEAAVAADAVDLWLITGHYQPNARTWPTDVIPGLARHGLTRNATTPVTVRDVIVRAATTVLEEEI